MLSLTDAQRMEVVRRIEILAERVNLEHGPKGDSLVELLEIERAALAVSGYARKLIEQLSADGA